MQQNVPQPASSQPQAPVQAPIPLTQDQLRQVSGAGPQECKLPGGKW